MKLTIDDIARISGFSRATVCRVLANSDKVRDSTKQAILDVIQKNHYAANALEHRQAGRSPIALIVGDIVDTESSSQLFHPQIMKTLCRRMYGQGYDCLLFDSGYSAELEDEYLHRCMEQGAAGIFLLSATGTINCLQQVVEKIPIVTINRHVNTPFTDAVLLDEYKCAYLAVKHLYDLGHRKIGLISEPKEIPLAYETERGFRDVSAQFCLASPENNMFQCAANFDDGYQLGKRLIADHSQVTGVFCVSYDIAAGIEAAYTQAGLSIPEDFSIVIFQYISEQVQKNKIQFTSVGAYNLEDIANAAADTMLQRLREGKSASRRLSVIVDTFLVIGKSTAPPHK